MNAPLQPPPSDVDSSLPNKRGSGIGLGVLLLTVITVGAMALALRWPDSTLMHFWFIAQLVPVLYWLLIWAWVSWHPRDSDVD